MRREFLEGNVICSVEMGLFQRGYWELQGGVVNKVVWERGICVCFCREECF